jgi:hypothetical protein
MKFSLLLVGCLSSLSLQAEAQTQSELCIVKISACLMNPEVRDEYVPLSEYNGVTNLLHEYQALAAFTYSVRSTDTTHHWDDNLTNSDVQFEHQEADSQWFACPSDARQDALTQCQEMRDETVGGMEQCQ